jgi:hypothetical protein
MQKQAFLKHLKAYEAAPAEARDPVALAEIFVRHAAALAEDKQALAERVWTLLEQDEKSAEAMNVFAGAFTAADTIRQVATNRSQTGQLAHAASIRTQLMLRARKARLGAKTASPEYVVQDKLVAFQFADLLKVRRPKTLMERQKIKDIDYRSGIALKPPRASASQGVYLLRDKDTAIDVRRGIILPDRKAVRAAMNEDVATGRVPLDVWNVEELIRDRSTESGLPNDWNFHCFYGEIMRMGHIQRYPQKLNYGLDRRMRPVRWFQIDTTIPQDPVPRRPDPAFLKLAKRISLALPAPYVRVDFLTSDKGPVLIELTARPGILHHYDQATDRAMGEALLRAEARLEADLLTGKRFDAYHEILAFRGLTLRGSAHFVAASKKKKKSSLVPNDVSSGPASAEGTTETPAAAPETLANAATSSPTIAPAANNLPSAIATERATPTAVASLDPAD